MINKKYGIRAQVAWLTLAPLLVMLTGLESFFLYDRYTELDRNLLIRGKSLSSQLAVSSEYGIFSGNQMFLQTVANSALLQADVSAIALLSPEGKILTTSGALPADQPDSSNWQLRVNSRQPVFDNGKVLLLYQPIWSVPVELDEKETKAQHAGAVVLAMNWESTRQVKSDLLWLTLIVTSVFLLVTLNLVFMASRRITEPIRKMSDMIRSIGHGQLDARVDISSHVSELSDVACGLNAMAAELQQEHAILHQRVADEIRLSAIAFESHESMMITDTAGVILRVNPAFTKTTGFMAGEAIGQTPRILKSGLHGEGFYAGMWDKLVCSGKWQGEIWDRRKSGEIFPSFLSITAILNSEGVVTHYLGAYIDITSRKRVEKQLADTLAFNETVLNQSPYGIAVYQADGKCVMANQAYANALGSTTDEILQQNFYTGLSWQDSGLINDAHKVLMRRETLRRDVDCVTPSAKHVTLECISSYLKIAQNPHIMLMISDISARVSAERALNESNQLLARKELAKTRFLAAAGHDLRQPLTAASMFIYALKSTPLEKPQAEIVRQLEHSMLTFSGLLDALLNVSKLDAGRIKPVYKSINVFDLLAGLEQDFSPMVREKNLGFRLYFSMKEMLFLHSDFGLVKSVLINLVSNAIKFTQQGSVMVSVRRRGTDALFQIWDTGIGIPEEALPCIFDEFYQVDNPQRDRNSGLGLGLSIVRRTLELLGSEIKCCSRPGHGTVFEFRLPLHKGAQPPAAEPAPASADDLICVRSKRFMVVEDDLLVSQATRACLEGMGAEVRVFHQAEAALKHALSEAADYYLVDYMLGGEMDGIQFLNQLQEQTFVPVKAVLMTGDTSSRFILHSENFAWQVLYKPLHIPELLASLGLRKGT